MCKKIHILYIIYHKKTYFYILCVTMCNCDKTSNYYNLPIIAKIVKVNRFEQFYTNIVLLNNKILIKT